MAMGDRTIVSVERESDGKPIKSEMGDDASIAEPVCGHTDAVASLPVVVTESQPPRRPPILVTDGPLQPGYYLVAREGYGLRVVRILPDGSQELINQSFYERLKKRKVKRKRKKVTKQSKDLNGEL